MRQFTDTRIDSAQFAHTARTKQVELQIAELMMVAKRAIRKSNLYRAITLFQYDQFIIGIEKAIREWLVKEEKSPDELLEVIDNRTRALMSSVSTPNQLEDLTQKIAEEISYLKKSGFLKIL